MVNNPGKGFADAVTEAIGELNRRGFGFSALLCDSIFSSDGVYSDPAGFLKEAIDRVHQANGVYIADEVQPGFGRCGTHMWGFQRHGVMPDYVTMGKPMGNGFPMAGVAAGSASVQQFCEDVGYFNTFGGNPVAAAAGLAVLNVLEKENLLANAITQGQYIRDGLRSLSSLFSVVGDVRGAGLFLGVDICKKDGVTPDPELTSQIIQGLKLKKVLVGAAGKLWQHDKDETSPLFDTARCRYFSWLYGRGFGAAHCLTRTSHEHFVKTGKPFVKAVFYRRGIVIERMTKCSPEVSSGGASFRSVLAVNIANYNPQPKTLNLTPPELMRKSGLVRFSHPSRSL